MGGVLRLAIDCAGIYGAFLSWALLQERLSTTPYETPGGSPRFFRAVVFLNTVQSAVAACAALLYLLARRPRGQNWSEMIGLGARTPQQGHKKQLSDSGFSSPRAPKRQNAWPLLGRILQCAVCQSIASPLTFLSLRHIDYPTMILGKSCKLIPVMLMNVLLYRRRFAPHKYLVVGMVTAGISLFTLFAPVSAYKRKGGVEQSSLLGLGLLLLSLGVDGATNSTQDEVFARYRISGSQMMFFMNVFASVLTSAVVSVPLPSVPWLGLTSSGESELSQALDFISAHPGVLHDIMLYALAGALGQLFIFDTLEHFGSLTLVTVTVTRKLFTMLLSVVIYKHHLAPLQWSGVALVFLGIGVEAQIKRKGGLRKEVLSDEKQKARLKAI